MQRHADGLLITGPVTKNMELALKKIYGQAELGTTAANETDVEPQRRGGAEIVEVSVGESPTAAREPRALPENV